MYAVVSNYTDDIFAAVIASHSPVYSTLMSPFLMPLHLVLMMFAGWLNRHQLDLIDYIQEENRLLKQWLVEQRIHFTDSERRRLARKAFVLGRKVLNELQTPVTPDTLLRWHRELVARKLGLQPPAWAWPAAYNQDARRSHSPNGR